MRSFSLILFCVLLETIYTFPYNGFREFPQTRTVMFGGYYGQPLNGRGIPQSMTIASGDTIATNSFVGDQFPQLFDFEETTEKRKTLQDNDTPISIDSDDESFTSEETINSKRLPKRKKPQRPQIDQDENEDDGDDSPSNWPLQGNRNGVPSYNAFFPIMIGGSGSRTRSSNDEGSYPGSATAIANSFSTGKGGVATSHATSYGDPYLSTLLRNGNFNPNSRKFGQ